MSKRGAIELSMNFIVILIISIVIFGFGIKFMSSLASQATELQQLTTSELDEKIGNLVCEGSDRVCIGIDRQKIRRTEFGIFGIKIINILENPDIDDFDITISAPDPMGFTKDKLNIEPHNPHLLINPELRTIKIGQNEAQDIAVGIQVPANAVPGTYIFNVEILTENGDAYSSIQKLYVDVP